MASRPTMVLMPGLDGTGKLFEPLLSALAPGQSAQVQSYPPDRPLGYDELVPLVLEQLPRKEPFILVAESFSGPLAVKISAREPKGLLGLVLVASFLRSPIGLPRWSASLIPSFLFWLPPPKSVVRRLLLGADAPAELVEAVQEAVHDVSGRVIAHRLAEILRVDVVNHFRELHIPVLYLSASADALVRGEALKLLRDLKTDLEVETFQAPHLILQCAPVEAERALSAFIARLEGSGEARRMKRHEA